MGRRPALLTLLDHPSLCRAATAQPPTLHRVTGLGDRLRRLDARFAPAGAGSPPPPTKRGWVAAAALLGLATLGLLTASVLVDAVLTFFVAPVGIVFGWVMGRIYEARAQPIGRGVARRT